MENLVIFVVGLLDNWMVKVTKTFTDILKYYVLQTNANKSAVHEKVYVVSKYLKFIGIKLKFWTVLNQTKFWSSQPTGIIYNLEVQTEPSELNDQSVPSALHRTTTA